MVSRNVKFITSLATLGLFSCAVGPAPLPDDPRFQPIIPEVSEAPKPVGGSLYVKGTGLSLYQDMKAHRVGDIITVRLVEATKASKDAALNSKKEFDQTITNPTLFGTTPQINTRDIPILGKLPILNNKAGFTLGATVDNSTEFKGKGDSSQNNSLSGDITVSVSQVLSNGNLVIRGEKWMTLNQGSEYIRLTGIVRQQDIGPNNEVLSNRIANARITYSGTGDVANSSKMGWISKFFNSALWPF